MRARTLNTLLAALALILCRASTVEASQVHSSFLLSDVQVLWDSPIGAPIALAGPSPAARPFDYGLFAAELVAFIAKEVLRDSPDEFAGNSLLPSTLSPSMPDTDHDFGDHCLKVVKDIGGGISSAAPAVRGVARTPAAAELTGQAIGAAFALREVWNLIRNDIVQTRSEGFSLHPKVGSNKVALSLTLRW